VISVVPFEIFEEKPGVVPTRYKIPPCDVGETKSLIVRDGQAKLYIDEFRGTLSIEVSAHKIAESIVHDFVISLPAVDGSAKPGLMWVEGLYQNDEVIKKFALQIVELRGNQNAWFKRLVAMADDEWSRTHMLRSISDLQRYAAKSLGFSREWLLEAPTSNAIRCPACLSVVSGDALVCINCRTILNIKEFEARGLRMAG